MPGGIKLYLSGSTEDTVMIVNNGVSTIKRMSCEHEVADQRLTYHTLNIHNTVERTVIHSNDTDVIVLAVYYACTYNLRNVFVRTDYDKYIDVHIVVQDIGETACKLLPFLHSIGGRDTASFFVQCWKREIVSSWCFDASPQFIDSR